MIRVRSVVLPLRVRLVAGFSAAMLVVLLGAGVFVYWRVNYALDRGLDTELTQAATTLRPLVGPDGIVQSRATAEATGVAWQVLAGDGAVLDRGGPASTVGMVSASQLARVGTATRSFDVGRLLPASSAPYRLRVIALADGPSRYLLVGVRRDHRDEALRELLGQLALAGLGALVVTAFVGDRLARAALRPVERYRRRAAEIAEGAHHLRLDVPPDRDDEVTRLGHTFNDMLTALDRALDRERQFVNEASHELRTPITLLSGRVQLAGRRRRSVEQHERILAELQIDLDRLAELAEQLLQVGSASEAGRSGAADLRACIVRVVERHARSGLLVAGELAVDLDPPIATVDLTEVEAERIVTNLLDNARLHGAPPHRLRLVEPIAGWVAILVSDGGPGLPPDLLSEATQRFTRGADARGRPGSGLGLSLVQVLVLRAGGEVRMCFGGHHWTHGAAAPVPCTHGDDMTVSVLLPVDERS